MELFDIEYFLSVVVNAVVKITVGILLLKVVDNVDDLRLVVLLGGIVIIFFVAEEDDRCIGRVYFVFHGDVKRLYVVVYFIVGFVVKICIGFVDLGLRFVFVNDFGVVDFDTSFAVDFVFVVYSDERFVVEGLIEVVPLDTCSEVDF